jgi:formylglycine-generating enzyme required for sulfatase activity
MKKLKYAMTCLFLCLGMWVQAQTITNFKMEQMGQKVQINYTLTSAGACEVQLWVSTDNGKTWSGPLQQVSGDVGKNVGAGNKQMVWDVLSEREQLVGDQIRFKLVANGKKSLEPEMIFVEGGTFQMGSSSGNSDEQPVHSVTLSSFNIGKYEVTQVQWKAVMGSNPSYNSGCDNCPVEQVSWNDVQQYIQKLNAQTGKNYRLPTEAEWEYAAKGGKASRGYTYSGSNDIGSVAWYDGNSGSKTHAIGTKQANELGIFDMSGNVYEWCSDWYGNYVSYSVTNPSGASSGEYRVLRGGSWSVNANYCRTTNRNRIFPDYRNNNYGFRLVLPAVR